MAVLVFLSLRLTRFRDGQISQLSEQNIDFVVSSQALCPI
jgi:hypothetical protein